MAEQEDKKNNKTKHFNFINTGDLKYSILS